MRANNICPPAVSAPFLDSFLEEFLGPRADARQREGIIWPAGPGGSQKATTRVASRGLGFLVLAGVLLSSTLGAAQDYRGTAEQRASCMPDAFRLCASFIPDASRVEMCLSQRKSELSQACRSIFEHDDGSVASRIRTDSLTRAGGASWRE